MPAVLAAQDEAADSPLRRKIPAVSVLPPGSVLQGVTLPRYDDERRLTSTLHAKSVTLLSEERLVGEALVIELFHQSGATRGQIELQKASLDQESGILTASERVRIGPIPSGDNQLTAEGSGLVFDLGTSQAYLIGPTVTRIVQPPATAMNHRPLSTAVMLAAATLPAATAQEPAPPAAEPSLAAEASRAQEESRTELRNGLARSAAASRGMAEFLERAATQEIQAPPPAPRHEPDQAPAEVQLEGTETVIRSSDGLYLNSDEGVAAFVGDVQVDNPQIKLSGANELKIFFEKKPEEEQAADAPADDNLGGAFGSLGDPQRLVATGAVKVRLIPEDGEPVEASGAMMTYNMSTGQIIIQGGYPWVIQKGLGELRAQEPNLILRVDMTTGRAVTEGRSSTIGSNLVRL